jgi:1,4-alpha-glucan branching enzyme
MIAEESTAWPRVTHGDDRDGLGFDQKWNMGWMNDTLDFMSTDPIHRVHRYSKLTFSIVYAFTERFVLPLSHDEVVHEKASLLSKMPGPDEEKFASLRLLYSYMWTHPGKKLLFMGGEFAQRKEWDVDGELEWGLQEYGPHRGVMQLIRDLNGLYRTEPALHLHDDWPESFQWLDCHDPERTTISYVRYAPDWEDFLVVAANFTPGHYDGFRVAVPRAGLYRVILNSDAPVYGGHGAVVPPLLESRPGELHGREHYLELPLPGLAVVVLKLDVPAEPGPQRRVLDR